MSEIDFSKYLSEDERKVIAEQVFRDVCFQTFQKDAERIFSNAAYHAVYKLVDEQHNGKAGEIIAEKAIKLIDELSVFTVFKRKDFWEKDDSAGYKALNEAIVHNKEKLTNKIATIIIQCQAMARGAGGFQKRPVVGDRSGIQAPRKGRTSRQWRLARAHVRTEFSNQPSSKGVGTVSLLPTRAQVACASGITPAKLSARTKKAIEEIEKRISVLAEPYAEIDNSVVGAQAELEAAFDKFKQYIIETQRYLEESA